MSVSGHSDPQSTPSDAAGAKAPTVEQLLPDPCRTAPLLTQDDIAATLSQSPGLGDSAALPIPAVPDYEILAEIGRGGMGVVYKARHIALNRVVALKMVLHGEYASPEARRRFRSEAEAVARIQHPHIVQVFDIGEQDGRLYFALEYCSAGSLAVKLNGKSQPPREAAGLVALLARAVHAIHQQQIVHRDLKPANVLFAADGQPKITDFGLARRLDEHTQTQTGAVIGTPNYMAPEQARGDTKQVGPAVDIYALGAILYECLTGRRLFLASNALATLADVLEKAPTSPRSLNRSVGRDLETICLKCLEKDPAKRYASAEDLAEDLERYIRGEPVRARRVSRLGRGMRWARRRPALALCLVLLFVAILAAVSLWKWGDDHRKAAAKAVREREEIQRFVEGLSPQQKEVMREFSAWIKERPHLANMRFEDAFARYKQENPGVVEVFQTAPPEVSAADVVSYPMIGD